MGLRGLARRDHMTGNDEDERDRPDEGVLLDLEPVASGQGDDVGGYGERARQGDQSPGERPRAAGLMRRAPGVRSHRLHVGGPHRLDDDRLQVAAQRDEVDLVAQPGTERLRSSARRRSGCGRSGGRPSAGSGPAPAGTAPRPPAWTPRRPAPTFGEAAERELQEQHAADVHAGESGGQRAVDQGPVDHDVDVVEPVAQRSRPPTAEGQRRPPARKMSRRCQGPSRR